MTDQIYDVLLGSDRSADNPWAKRHGFMDDITLLDYGFSSWSVSCNLAKIDNGTIGWIYRSDGNWGHIAGIMAINGVAEERGDCHYAKGAVFPLPRDWWLDGARLHMEGWNKLHAPFGMPGGHRIARIQNGVSIARDSMRAISKLLHPVAMEWVLAKRCVS